MQMQWSVLKYFEPISLHQNLNNPAKPKGAEEQRTLMDIVWKVSPCTRKQKMHRLLDECADADGRRASSARSRAEQALNNNHYLYSRHPGYPREIAYARCASLDAVGMRFRGSPRYFTRIREK